MIVMRKKELIRLRRTLAAGVSAAVLLAGAESVAVCADDDDITIDDGEGYTGGGSIDAGDSGGSIDAGDSGSDSAFLIEDTGEDVSYNAGVPMDTLQDAMESGDTKTLEKIASLGALTTNPTVSKGGSGIGGGGAYRGTDDDEDDEEYYDLQLDEGDADEVETTNEENPESPGALIAANESRIQEYLDEMTQVESPTGSDGELTVASYIETKLGELGYTVQEQAFHEGVVNEDGIDAPGVNVLAERGANSQTNRKSDIFLVVTHYDSKRSPDEGDPFANDKSGAAALIESARILSEVVTDTDICFLFLSGQEDGGYGAQRFIESLSEENRSRISGVLNVYRVGYDSDTPYVLKTLTGERNYVGDLVQQLGLTNDAHLSLRRESSEDPDEDDGMWVGVGESSDGYIDENTAQQIAAEQSGTAGEDEHAIDIDTNEYMEDEVSGEVEMDAPAVQEAVAMPASWSYLKDSSPTVSSFAGESFTTVAVSQYMPSLDSASYEETKALGLADTAVVEIDGAKAQGLGIAQSSEANAGMPDADGTAGAGVEGADAAAAAGEAAVEPEQSDLTGASQEAPAAFEDGSSMELTAEDGYEIEVSEEYMEEEDEDRYVPTVDAALVADTTNVIAAALANIMDPAT